MSDIGRAGGPLPIGNNYSQSDDKSATTVQVGEKQLSDVAGRLGVDSEDLQKANPQFSDDTVLKAGQEIKLPQNQHSQGPSEARGRDDDSVRDKASQPPSSPIGDPLAKGFFQSQLDHASKTEFAAKDLGQAAGGASAGKPSIENAAAKKVDILYDQALGQPSGGASVGKFQPETQNLSQKEGGYYQWIKDKPAGFAKYDVSTQDGASPNQKLSDTAEKPVSGSASASKPIDTRFDVLKLKPL